MEISLAGQIQEAVQGVGQSKVHTQASSHGRFCVGGAPRLTLCRAAVCFLGGLPHR